MNEKHAPIPNIAAIHDLAAWGRCSLSVVIPVLSAMGFQVTPLPTALLSTHTGDFDGFSFLDLTDQMQPMADHWKTLGIPFCAIYSGFLGSERQIRIVSDFIDEHRNTDTVVLVDPVLGDDGVFYKTCTDELCEGMRRLAAKADVLCPNLTEAHLLLGLPYRSPASLAPSERDAYYRMLLDGLHALGPKTVLITGYEETEPTPKIGVIVSDGVDARVFLRDKVEKSYPGTGELFASVFLGAVLGGHGIMQSADFAVGYVTSVITDSAKEDYPTREGVLLERNLAPLCGLAKNLQSLH